MAKLLAASSRLAGMLLTAKARIDFIGAASFDFQVAAAALPQHHTPPQAQTHGIQKTLLFQLQSALQPQQQHQQQAILCPHLAACSNYPTTNCGNGPSALEYCTCCYPSWTALPQALSTILAQQALVMTVGSVFAAYYYPFPSVSLQESEIHIVTQCAVINKRLPENWLLAQSIISWFWKGTELAQATQTKRCTMVLYILLIPRAAKYLHPLDGSKNRRKTAEAQNWANKLAAECRSGSNVPRDLMIPEATYLD
eukprot:1158743-Pelagomonas_calceolata.AAC.44